jgi:hypothetical protein
MTKIKITNKLVCELQNVNYIINIISFGIFSLMIVIIKNWMTQLFEK